MSAENEKHETLIAVARSVYEEFLRGSSRDEMMPVMISLGVALQLLDELPKALPPATLPFKPLDLGQEIFKMGCAMNRAAAEGLKR